MSTSAAGGQPRSEEQSSSQSSRKPVQPSGEPTPQPSPGHASALQLVAALRVLAPEVCVLDDRVDGAPLGAGRLAARVAGVALAGKIAITAALPPRAARVRGAMAALRGARRACAAGTRRTPSTQPTTTAAGSGRTRRRGGFRTAAIGSGNEPGSPTCLPELTSGERARMATGPRSRSLEAPSSSPWLSSSSSGCQSGARQVPDCWSG
jgi:hypothetical protein